MINIHTIWTWERETLIWGGLNATPQGFKHIEAETNDRHVRDDIFKCIFLNEIV